MQAVSSGCAEDSKRVKKVLEKFKKELDKAEMT